MLDTDICIYVMKDRPSGLRKTFNQQHEFLSISSVTLAELLYGAEKSAKPGYNLNIIEHFAARLVTLPFEDKAAAHYGQIRAGPERQGRPIGPYDLMIAGHARSEGLILVTNNSREFDRVDGLRLENWSDPGSSQPSTV